MITQIPTTFTRWTSTVWPTCSPHLTESGCQVLAKNACQFSNFGNFPIGKHVARLLTQVDKTDESLPSVAREIKRLGQTILLGILRAIRNVRNAVVGVWNSFLAMRQNSSLRATVRASIKASPQGCAICALGTALFATFIAMSALRGNKRQRNVGRAGCAAIVIATLFFL